MNNKIVVDTSVIIKWLNSDNELLIEEADRLLEECLKGKVKLYAPELAKYEIGNVLLKAKKLTPSETHILFDTIYSLPIEFVPETEEMAFDTFLLAHKSGITYYDAAFLTVAKINKATLITENIKHQGKITGIPVISLEDYSK